MINIGVDSCPAGWIAVYRDENGKFYRIRRRFSELFTDLNPNRGFCLVDIPIGLCNEPRLCDKIARSILGKRSSSVFSTPVLDAVYAETYEKAKEENFKLTGKYISKQAWNICPKIRDVNDYINKQVLGVVIKEMHPEVCFWALNDKKPCKHYKKTQEGKDERLDILSRYDSWAGLTFDHIRRNEPRKVVADDDIIDALVGLVTLMTDKIISFPSQVQRGANGLISEMVFYNGEEQC